MPAILGDREQHQPLAGPPLPRRVHLVFRQHRKPELNMSSPDDHYVWRLTHDGSLIFRDVQPQSPLMKTENVEPRVFFV